MHNNYYFLRQFSARLQLKIKGWQIGAIFSQQRDELIIGFTNGEEEFYVKASLTQQFSCLSTSGNFGRARRNSVDLFSSLIGTTVTKVEQQKNERSFYLQLSNRQQLLFKMFGNRSNVVLFENGQPVKIFNNQLKNDWDLRLAQMDRELDFSREFFLSSDIPLKKLYPTLGDLVINYLESLNFSALERNKQWELLSETIAKLENPDVYRVIEYKKQVRLSLIPFGAVLSVFTDPLEAAGQFARLYLSREGFQSLYQKWHQSLSKLLQQSEQYIKKNEAQLKELEQGRSYSQLADVLMANLHQIPAKATEARLFNFYTDSDITIKLKITETPQKLAERYYRKAKQQPLQISRLRSAIEAKELVVLQLQEKLEQLELITDLKTLKSFVQSLEGPIKAVSEPKSQVPFKVYRFQGFDIWVGRSARNNDILTQKFAHKDDVWLHAKDVPGSHVIIRQQPGKAFPVPVIEVAAQLAAWHSKRRNDSLCPVSYTPKKYVRKRKGAADGEVVVEREKVILVVPAEFDQMVVE